jgi:polyvinyl alcohol dehydrogenase (cytochrome)
MYLKDLAHSSYSSTEIQLTRTTIQSLQPSWSISLTAQLGAAVTVSNGTLYFGDWNGYFHALDSQTGNELWKTFVGMAATPGNPICQPAIGVTSQATVIGNTVYVGGGDSAVYALDRSTGSQLWRLPLADPTTGSYIWSSIVPYQNQIYAGVASLGDCPVVPGLIARIDPSNPQKPLIAYLVPQGEQGAGLWTTPAVNPQTNTLFIDSGNPGNPTDLNSPGNLSEAMFSMDATSLQVKSVFRLPASEANGDFDWGSSPTLFTPANGVPMVAASGKDGILYALRQDDMKLVWQRQVAMTCDEPQYGCGSLSTPAFDGTTLFMGAGERDPNNASEQGSVYAINPADGSVLWEHDTSGTVIAPVTLANGMVFVSTQSELEIYDAATGQFLWSDGNRGPLYSQPVVLNGTVYSTYLSGDVIAWRLPEAADTLYSFSAATGLPSLAPAAIASAYGNNLTKLSIQDSSGAHFQAQVLAATSGQINYVVPAEAALGQAIVTASDSSGATQSTPIQISQASPGIFSANENGQGVAAAQALIVHADGSRAFLQVFQCDSAPGSCVPTPIDLGSSADQVFLTLYGTGIRNAAGLQNVTCTIGGETTPAVFAGPQGSFNGLDQVNIQIPSDLAGRGVVNVVLSVDGQLSNTVTINVM